MKAKTRTLTMGGAVLAALASSLCCIGPLLGLTLGLGGFAGATSLGKWRALFVAVTSTLLALAWYLSYRKPRNACAKIQSCALACDRMILLTGTVFALATAAFPAWSEGIVFNHPSTRSLSPDSTVSSHASLELSTPTIDCAACARLISERLQKEAGVNSATVTFLAKTAVVQYDPTRISSERIISVVNQTGFKAVPKTKKKDL
jgi:copper chaperone CopZ